MARVCSVQELVSNPGLLADQSPREVCQPFFYVSLQQLVTLSSVISLGGRRRGVEERESEQSWAQSHHSC